MLRIVRTTKNENETIFEEYKVERGRSKLIRKHIFKYFGLLLRLKNIGILIIKRKIQGFFVRGKMSTRYANFIQITALEEFLGFH